VQLQGKDVSASVEVCAKHGLGRPVPRVHLPTAKGADNKGQHCHSKQPSAPSGVGHLLPI